jgi:hypothetical protein
MNGETIEPKLSRRRRHRQVAFAKKLRLPVLVLLTALAHWEYAAVCEKLGVLNCKILGLPRVTWARAIWRCAVRR